MFITPAFAQDAAAAAPTAGSAFMQFLPLIIIFFIFYFLLIRPQQKKMREHQSMLDALRKGDSVVTGGGIIGTVVKVEDADVTVEIADGVKVRVQKGTIGAVLSKTEPVK
jgi:preprotein translocase subunit YajC